MTSVALGNTVIDDSGVTVDGKPIKMTRTRKMLLRSLVERPGRVVSRAHLLDLLWGGRAAGPTDAVVQVHICNIRRILREAGSTVVITNAWGEGYKAEGPDTALVVRSFNPGQVNALARLMEIARPIAPDLVALLECAA